MDASDAQSLIERWHTASSKANARRIMRRTSHLGQPTTYVGHKRGLVILVEFPDLKMSTNDTQWVFYDMFNGKGYNNNGHIGSVSDYFADQSYGKLLLDFDIVGPLTVSRDMAYYGSNKGIGGSDRNPRQMVAEACLQADTQVNYRDYDWDGDGEVDQVFVVYAGYGEASGAPSYTIWPHESSLGTDGYWGEGKLTLDGTIIDTYACSSELAGTIGTTLDGIGTACHEFCHCLGLPDFYDISYTGGFGMHCWDLMDAGVNAGPRGNGEVPYGFSAYERWFAGWLTFREVRHSQAILDMPDVAAEPVAYVIRNQENTDELFILENHQAARWFSYAHTTAGCHGLMVTHVDYDPANWTSNRVNNNNRHQRMSIIPADASYGTLNAGRYYTYDDELMGDLFPGGRDITHLNRTSHTAVGGHLYQPSPNTPRPLEYILNDIRESDGRISLYVINPDSIFPPKDIQTAQTSQDAFNATWNSVPEAESYDIELTRITSMKPYRAKTQLITGITETSHDFTNINERNVRIRIRSIVRGIPSEWSHNTALELTTDAIHDVRHNTSTTNGTTLNGMPLSQHHSTGIVILRQGNTARKVVTKQQ